MNRKLYETLLLLDENDRNVVIDNLSNKSIQQLHEIQTRIDLRDPVRGGLAGAGIGAGVGALGTGGVWAVKRLALRRKLKQCISLPPAERVECENKVKAEIDTLNKKYKKRALAATLGGAAVGGGIGAYGGHRLKQKQQQQLQQQPGGVGSRDQGVSTGSRDQGVSTGSRNNEIISEENRIRAQKSAEFDKILADGTNVVSRIRRAVEMRGDRRTDEEAGELKYVIRTLRNLYDECEKLEEEFKSKGWDYKWIDHYFTRTRKLNAMIDEVTWMNV